MHAIGRKWVKLLFASDVEQLAWYSIDLLKILSWGRLRHMDISRSSTTFDWFSHSFNFITLLSTHTNTQKNVNWPPASHTLYFLFRVCAEETSCSFYTWTDGEHAEENCPANNMVIYSRSRFLNRHFYNFRKISHYSWDEHLDEKQLPSHISSFFLSFFASVGFIAVFGHENRHLIEMEFFFVGYHRPPIWDVTKHGS